MDFLDAHSMVDEAMAKLRQHGLETQWRVEPTRNDSGLDGIARLSWQGRTREFQIELKASLRPSTALMTLDQLTGARDTLLIAPSIAGRLAELTRALGLNYVDLAGNCYLSCPEFLIDVRGHRSPIKPKEPPAGFTKTDLRVILALIVDPDLVTASSRELGERVGVSHGAAHLAVSKMGDRGFLTKKGLRRGAKLMDEWTKSYLTRSGAHRTSRTIFVDEKPNWARLLPDASDEIQLSGESAGEILGWPIRSSSAILYANTFARAARVVRGRSHGDGFPIEVRAPILAPSDNDSGISASLLVQADMLASNEPRQFEVAQEAITYDKNLRHLQQTP